MLEVVLLAMDLKRSSLETNVSLTVLSSMITVTLVAQLLIVILVSTDSGSTSLEEPSHVILVTIPVPLVRAILNVLTALTHPTSTSMTELVVMTAQDSLTVKSATLKPTVSIVKTITTFGSSKKELLTRTVEKFVLTVMSTSMKLPTSVSLVMLLATNASPTETVSNVMKLFLPQTEIPLLLETVTLLEERLVKLSTVTRLEKKDVFIVSTSTIHLMKKVFSPAIHVMSGPSMTKTQTLVKKLTVKSKSTEMKPPKLADHVMIPAMNVPVLKTLTVISVRTPTSSVK